MSQSQQSAIFNTTFEGWEVLIGDVNQTLVMPTSTLANSLFGLLPAGESVQPNIDGRPIGLSKGLFGEDNPIEYVSGGQKATFTFSVHEMGKGAMKRILSSNVTTTSLVATTPDIGTVSGRPEAGRWLQPFRFVLIPHYLAKNGTFINGITDNEYMIEIPRGQILTPWNPEFATGEFPMIELEIHAMPDPLKVHKPFNIGPINLVVTP